MTRAVLPSPVVEAWSPDEYLTRGFGSPDVYYLPGYGRAEEANGAGRWLSLVAFNGSWQMPVHLRASSVGKDAVSPYGYAGVFADSRLTAAQRREAWTQAMHELRKHGVLSIFLRQSPLLSIPWDEPPGERVVRSHPTVRVPTYSADDVWTGMQGRSRTSVRKADRDGFRSVLRSATREDLVPSAPFRCLYESAMQRRQALERYFFVDDYYDILLETLGQDLLIGLTEDASGATVAAALFMRHGQGMHYHLSGSEPGAGRAGATNQLLWEALRRACSMGVEWVHLGGGVSGNDSLLGFKRSFGGGILEFSAYGVVLDEVDYGKAVTARAAELGVPVEQLTGSGYFPRFRTPV